jgi:hypothetical protein
MGQSAIGVMYGCQLPEGLDVYGEESDGPDLVRRTLNLMRRSLRNTLILQFQEVIGWEYESDFRSVEVEGVDDVPIIGVLVAVSGSGKNGAADLWTTQRLADIPSLPETVKARETWKRFVEWCKERQVDIPTDAELWIVTTETA